MSSTFTDIFTDFLLRHGSILVELLFGIIFGVFVRRLDKHLWLKGFMDRLGVEAKDVVMEMNQTFVDQLRIAKEDGVITSAERAEAFSMALAKLKSNIGPKLLERAARVLGYDDAGMDRLLGTKIEANVQKQNLIKSSALPPVSVDGSSTLPPARPPSSTSQR